jgi:hypothetical protein
LSSRNALKVAGFELSGYIASAALSYARANVPPEITGLSQHDLSSIGPHVCGSEAQRSTCAPSPPLPLLASPPLVASLATRAPSKPSRPHAASATITVDNANLVTPHIVPYPCETGGVIR